MSTTLQPNLRTIDGARSAVVSNVAQQLRAEALAQRSGWAPQTPTPVQRVFLDLTCREALYGGAAGGGKSSALLMAALQYVDVPGYAALLLRRTYADLSKAGALMDRAAQWLRNTPARWDGNRHMWTFPSGASLSFGYLETEGDRLNYQSAEFQFCVAMGTPVLMADGTWRPIEAVRVGDLVATLEGPRPVTATHRPGVKPAVRIRTAYGDATVSASHRLMLASGAWAAPSELPPRKYHPDGSTSAVSTLTSRPAAPPHACRRLDRPPTLALVPPRIAETPRQDCAALLGGDRSGDGGTGERYQESWRPQTCRVSLARYVLAPLSRESDSLGHDAVDGPHGEVLRDSPSGYPLGRRCDGAHAHPVLAADRDGTLQPSGAVIRSPHGWHPGDRVSTPECSHRLYVHPYTKALHQTATAFAPMSAEMVPTDAAEVADLTVASASHYIVFPGIIASNCGWDELTHFTETQYRFLFSRLRRLTGVDIPIRMRAATNPGGPGHAWVHQRFLVEGPTHGRIFVPARLDDNPHLDREEYLESLSELDDVTRAQMELGSWDAAEAGNKFKREWWTDYPARIVDAAPPNLDRVRYWDLASTEPRLRRGRMTDPDYTVGALLGRHAGVYYVLDLERFRGTPLEVQARIKATAQADRRHVPIYIEQEPGSNAEIAMDHYRRTVLDGYDFHAVRSTGTKELRANPLSAAAEAGNVRLVRGPWLTALLDELCAFPNGTHDDQVDAVSGAYTQLAARARRSAFSSAVGPPRPPLPRFIRD